jgi:hypothetical protein
MLLFGESILFHHHARRSLDGHDLVMDVGISTSGLNASHHGLNDNGGFAKAFETRHFQSFLNSGLETHLGVGSSKWHCSKAITLLL